MKDPREKLAKRTRYAAGAMQEQSMGRSGKCFARKSAISDELAWTVRGSAGLSYSKALRLVKDASLQTVPVSAPDVDPTQQSFVDHMSAFAEAFLAVSDCNQNNLPLTFSTGPVDAWKLCDPVLLLGTAGIGKTTTVQAANRVLESKGMQRLGCQNSACSLHRCCSKQHGQRRPYHSVLVSSSLQIWRRSVAAFVGGRDGSHGRRTWSYGRSGIGRSVHDRKAGACC